MATSAHTRPSNALAASRSSDYRIDNTILDSADATRVRAVLDWELSTLGDPLSDAALMCVYRDAQFDLLIDVNAAWTSPLQAGRLRTGASLFNGLRTAVVTLGLLHGAGVLQVGHHRGRN